MEDDAKALDTHPPETTFRPGRFPLLPLRWPFQEAGWTRSSPLKAHMTAAPPRALATDWMLQTVTRLKEAKISIPEQPTLQEDHRPAAQTALLMAEEIKGVLLRAAQSGIDLRPVMELHNPTLLQVKAVLDAQPRTWASSTVEPLVDLVTQVILTSFEANNTLICTFQQATEVHGFRFKAVHGFRFNLPSPTSLCIAGMPHPMPVPQGDMFWLPEPIDVQPGMDASLLLQTSGLGPSKLEWVWVGRLYKPTWEHF